jgi:hypothetical protein
LYDGRGKQKSSPLLLYREDSKGEATLNLSLKNKIFSKKRKMRKCLSLQGKKAHGDKDRWRGLHQTEGRREQRFSTANVQSWRYCSFVDSDPVSPGWAMDSIYPRDAPGCWSSEYTLSSKDIDW